MISEKTLQHPVLVLITFILLGVVGIFTIRKTAIAIKNRLKYCAIDNPKYLGKLSLINSIQNLMPAYIADIKIKDSTLNFLILS